MGKKIFISHILIIVFYAGMPNKGNTNLCLISDTVVTSSTNSDSVSGVTFIREVIYGDTDEILLGRILAVEVDDLRRVYIADGDHVNIHVYNPDGTYLKPLGRQGQGPGEFLNVSVSTQMEIHSNRLFVTDGDGMYIHRFHVFLLEDLSLLQTINLRAEIKKDYDEKLQKYFPRWIYPRIDNNFLVAYTFILSPEYYESERMIRYYLHNSNGDIISGPILEQKDRTYLVYRYPGIGRHVSSFPFFGKSLLVTSDDDYLYAVRTEELKIDILDPDGKHVQTIQHPFLRVPLTRSGLINMYKDIDMTRLDRYEGDDVALKMIREAESLPEAWPAIENMLIDDENHLWISTIVEDFDIYEWWVLEKTGELITKFEWPRNEPIEVVKNGYIYTRQTVEETGLQQVVRYRIDFDEVN